MPSNSIPAFIPLRTTATPAVEPATPRSPDRAGVALAAPASSSAARHKKRQALHKRINNELRAMQEKIGHTAARIGTMEQELRAMVYSKHASRAQQAVLFGALEELAGLYREQGENHAVQSREVIRLLHEHDDVLSDGKRSELFDMSTSLEVEGRLHEGQAKVQTGLFLALKALKVEQDAGLNDTLDQMWTLRWQMEGLSSFRHRHAKRSLKTIHDEYLPILIEQGDESRVHLESAGIELLEVRADNLPVIRPQDLPAHFDVENAGELFDAVHAYGRYYRQAILAKIQRSLKDIPHILDRVEEAVGDSREAHQKKPLQTAQEFNTYYTPLAGFAMESQKYAEKFSDFLSAPSVLQQQIRLMEHREEADELRELGHLQNSLLKISNWNIKASALRIEFKCVGFLRAQAQKPDDPARPAFPNATGFLVAVDLIGKLQALHERHLVFRDDFPQHLGPSEKQAIFPRMRMLHEAVLNAQEYIAMLASDFLDQPEEITSAQGFKTTEFNLKVLADALENVQGLLVDNMGKLAKTGFKPRPEEKEIRADKALFALREALAGIAERWDLTLPEADAQAAADAEGDADADADAADETGLAADTGDLRLEAGAGDENSSPAAARAAIRTADKAVEVAVAASLDAAGKPAEARSPTPVRPDTPAAPPTGSGAAGPGMSTKPVLLPAGAAAVVPERPRARADAEKRLGKAIDFFENVLPARLAVLESGTYRNLDHARTILKRLGEKNELKNLNPDDIHQFYKRAVNDVKARHQQLGLAARKWRAFEPVDAQMAARVRSALETIEARRAGLQQEITRLQAEGLRKTANGYAFKPSSKGMEFLFEHDFIDLASAPIKPYFVMANKVRLDPAQTDPAKRWRTETDASGNPLEESYQVFGIQIKPDPADPGRRGKNRLHYQVYMHAMLDENRPDAKSRDGRFFHPQSALQYLQYKWKRGDEHKRGKMWVDREQLALQGPVHGRGLQSNADVYRNFADAASFREYIPRYLRMSGGEPIELDEVDLRKAVRKGTH